MQGTLLNFKTFNIESETVRRFRIRSYSLVAKKSGRGPLIKYNGFSNRNLQHVLVSLDLRHISARMRRYNFGYLLEINVLFLTLVAKSFWG